RSSGPTLCQPEKPQGEIAHVDELDRTLWIAWRQHPTALPEPQRPIREPLRRIVRSFDHACTDIGRPIAKDIGKYSLTRRLECTVVPLDVLRLRIVEFANLVSLAVRSTKVTVD